MQTSFIETPPPQSLNHPRTFRLHFPHGSPFTWKMTGSLREFIPAPRISRRRRLEKSWLSDCRKSIPASSIFVSQTIDNRITPPLSCFGLFSLTRTACAGLVFPRNFKDLTGEKEREEGGETYPWDFNLSIFQRAACKLVDTMELPASSSFFWIIIKVLTRRSKIRKGERKIGFVFFPYTYW